MDKLRIGEKNFEKKLDFAIWSTGGSSDYSNDKDRPYNGQEHTDHGGRGKAEVKGLTMRDIADCIVQGFLAASGNTELQHKTKEIDNDMIGTDYENKNNWRYQDVYKIDMDLDPLAVVQNTMCFVEDMMGIYPNCKKLTDKEIDEFLTPEP